LSERVQVYFFYYFPIGLDVIVRRRATITWFLAIVSAFVFVVYKYAPVAGWWNLTNMIFYPLSPSAATSVTHAFLHGGWFHLIGNVVYLVVFGRAVEDRFGPGRFFLIYILATAAGAYTHLAFTRIFAPDYLVYGVIGASGATSGLLGAYIIRLYFSRVVVAYWVFFPLQGVNRAGRSYVPGFFAVLLWIVFQGVLTIVQFGVGGVQVAYSVHVGGFVAGALLAMLFGGSAQARAESHLVAARRHFRDAKWFASQCEYINYLERRPYDAEVHAEAARTFACTKDMARVRYHYTEAIDKYLRSRERSLAEEAFVEAMRAIKGFSLPEDMHLDLAFGLERILKFRSALAAYENFTFRYPMSEDTPFILLRMAGMLERRFQRPALALACFERLVECYPEDSWTDFARSEIERLRKMNIIVSRKED
jgi:membrane associated rhomboid family serine protease